MKSINRFFKIGIGSNLVILLAMTLLPAFVVTDQLDAFEKIISYLSET